jgi:hypothetical protein
MYIMGITMPDMANDFTSKFAAFKCGLKNKNVGNKYKVRSKLNPINPYFNTPSRYSL